MKGDRRQLRGRKDVVGEPWGQKKEKRKSREWVTGPRRRKQWNNVDWGSREDRINWLRNMNLFVFLSYRINNNRDSWTVTTGQVKIPRRQKEGPKDQRRHLRDTGEEENDRGRTSKQRGSNESQTYRGGTPEEARVSNLLVENDWREVYHIGSLSSPGNPRPPLWEIELRTPPMHWRT